MCRKVCSSILRIKTTLKRGMFCVLKPFLRIIIQNISMQIDATLMNEPHLFFKFTKVALVRHLIDIHA